MEKVSCCTHEMHNTQFICSRTHSSNTLKIMETYFTVALAITMHTQTSLYLKSNAFLVECFAGSQFPPCSSTITSSLCFSSKPDMTSTLPAVSACVLDWWVTSAKAPQWVSHGLSHQTLCHGVLMVSLIFHWFLCALKVNLVGLLGLEM